MIRGSIRYAPYKAHRAVCAECGEEFSCPEETRYKRLIDGNERVYCSYSCWRVLGRQDEEAWAEAIRRADEAYDRAEAARAAKAREWYDRKKAAKAARQSRKERLKELRKRVILCETNMHSYMHKAATLPKGSRKKRQAAMRGREWMRKLAEAKRMLEELEREESDTVCDRSGGAAGGAGGSMGDPVLGVRMADVDVTAVKDTKGD